MSKYTKERKSYGEWIPVSEALPEENGSYLVTVDSYDEKCVIRFIDIDHANASNGEFGGWLHYEAGRKPNQKTGRLVVAWMPLPIEYHK